MPRKIHHRFENPTSRLKLFPRPKPYPGPQLAPGLFQDYRRLRNKDGSWVARFKNSATGKTVTVKVGSAKDYTDEGLDFFEAQDVIRERFLRGANKLTVAGAFDNYEKDLSARDCNTYNAQMGRVSMSEDLLATSLTDPSLPSKLNAWVHGRLEKVARSSVTRTCNAARAAFELAAQFDKKIDPSLWRAALRGLPNSRGEARDGRVDDLTIRRLLQAAYARDSALALLLEVAAESGARMSQIARIKIADLEDHLPRPRIRMPRSAKSGARNRAEKRLQHHPVPISRQLAVKLRAAAADRPPRELLLLKADGKSWNLSPSTEIRRDWQRIVRSIGEDPVVLVPYCLRHSSIIRRLLSNVPTRLVCAWHDTSIAMVEKHYGKYIDEASDRYHTAGLFGESEPEGNNVVPIRKEG